MKATLKVRVQNKVKKAVLVQKSLTVKKGKTGKLIIKIKVQNQNQRTFRPHLDCNFFLPFFLSLQTHCYFFLLDRSLYNTKLNKSQISLKKGKKVTLKVVTKNVKKIVSVKWSSKNKKTATVSSKGKVTAKKA